MTTANNTFEEEMVKSIYKTEVELNRLRALNLKMLDALKHTRNALEDLSFKKDGVKPIAILEFINNTIREAERK